MNLIETMKTHDNQLVAAANGHQFTRSELDKMFSRVQNPENWKGPIDSVVELYTIRDFICVIEAVRFFAGCDAELAVDGFNTFDGCAVVRVRAIGYYAAVGA